MSMDGFFHCRLVSSLEKVFCEPELPAAPLARLSAARGETVAFQAAFTAQENIQVNFELKSELAPWLTAREVGLVPCELPAHPDDTDALRTLPGLFPDPLLPANGRLRVSRRNWHALWLSVKVPDDLPPGERQISVRFFSDSQGHDHSFDQTLVLTLDVLPFSLPSSQLLCTLWFHADCLWTYYRVPCWSEAHWRLLERYVRDAAEHGVNMLLTPLWTPPLDTAEGGERPTTQLLEIEERDGHYRFDFARLGRWMNMAEACGVTHFEFSHAFTQWGARCTPKIMVRQDGELRQVFGWHVAADAPEYRDFLRQLLPELRAFVRGRGLEGRCYFHISDEPSERDLESYRRASELLTPLLEGAPVLDALSEPSFFDRGLVKCPVPISHKLDEFMSRPIPRRWTYYCGGWDKVPNRQFGMASARNRILGLILYLYDLEGFLNWGYNFWYTQYSLDQHIDPYKVTDAGRAFCGGGSFMVYPGADGPVSSLHHEVFAEGLQDLRALRLLESQAGRDETVRLIHEGLDYQISMRRYPRDAAWLLALREKVNQCLASAKRR